LFTGEQVSTIPSQWSSLINPLANPVPLIDVNKPVTASPSVAYDGKNYWIYFGTGRFFDINDKADASQQTYYGIKEPMTFAGIPTNCIGTFTWETVEEMPSGLVPGSLGLTPVGDIRVGATSATLSCIDGTTNCLPKRADGITPLSNFDELEDYIAGTGTGCDAADTTGTDGWYRDFHGLGERNLGQAALLGGLLSFTSYQPYNDICRAEGQSFLYGIAYRTGTAYYPDVFGVGPDPFNNVVDRIDLGKGLAVTPNLHVGKSLGTKAFVQTSTGAIVEIPQPGTPESPGTGLTGWSDD
jgi:type IV pilus assembly protein PilY1